VTLWEVIYGCGIAGDLALIAGRVPMSCLNGDLDESAPLAWLRALVGSHLNCQVLVYHRATHASPLQQRAWVRAQITSMLSA